MGQKWTYSALCRGRRWRDTIADIARPFLCLAGAILPARPRLLDDIAQLTARQETRPANTRTNVDIRTH